MRIMTEECIAAIAHLWAVACSLVRGEARTQLTLAYAMCAGGQLPVSRDMGRRPVHRGQVGAPGWHHIPGQLQPVITGAPPSPHTHALASRPARQKQLIVINSQLLLLDVASAACHLSAGNWCSSSYEHARHTGNASRFIFMHQPSSFAGVAVLLCVQGQGTFFFANSGLVQSGCFTNARGWKGGEVAPGRAPVA
jgi:hypothetical protein